MTSDEVARDARVAADNAARTAATIAKKQTLIEHLDDIEACAEAREWVGTRTAREAWEQCERADWLLAWAHRTPVNPYHAVAAARRASVAAAEVAAEAAERAVRDAAHLVRSADAAAWSVVTAAMVAADAGRDAARAAAKRASETAAEIAADAGRDAVRAAADAAAWSAVATAMVAAKAARAIANAARVIGRDARGIEHRIMCAEIRSILILPWAEAKWR